MGRNCYGPKCPVTVRDTHDDFATILQGSLLHKTFEHVQNFRDPFASVCDTCEEIRNHGDCFKTALRHTREFWVGLQCVIVVFPAYTRLLFFIILFLNLSQKDTVRRQCIQEVSFISRSNRPLSHF